MLIAILDFLICFHSHYVSRLGLTVTAHESLNTVTCSCHIQSGCKPPSSIFILSLYLWPVGKSWTHMTLKLEHVTCDA